MQITQLRIAGFKSFVDPVEVVFEEGLTGVVGPNGCGKSNILEALRWAMGATSARAMRGGEMDDLIFSGSVTRPARERCEVTLTLDNSARTAPAELNDSDVLEVKRILRRGAGSTYKVNGRTVRAKDVQLLFADASTGANSPALVRQGQISELIASKPQNRRRILEEAAGIAGLNQRRHEAELKLRAALANLEQLDQLIGEIDRQSAALKRQAGKARKRRTLDAEAETLEIALTAWRWRNAVDERAQAQTALVEAENAVEDGLAKEAAAISAETNLRERIAPLREIETDTAGKLGALKLQLAQLDAEKRTNAGDIQRLEADLKRVVDDFSREHSLREEAADSCKRIRSRLNDMPEENPKSQKARADALTAEHDKTLQVLSEAETHLEEWSVKLAAIKAEARTAQSHIDKEEQRLATLDELIATASSELAQTGDQRDLESVLKNARTQCSSAEKKAASALRRLEQLESAAEKAGTAAQEAAAPVDDAEKLLRTLEAEHAGLTRLLQDMSPQDEAPILSETRPDKGYERALAAALGDDLNAPRGTSLRHYWSTNAGGSDAPGLPDGVKSLADLTDAPEELKPRLSQCGVTSAKDGPRLQSLLAQGQRLVSKAGDLWRWDGYVRTAKAPSSAAERLEQQTRRDVCKTEIEDARKNVGKLRKAHDRAQAKFEKSRNDAKDASKEAPELSADASRSREAVLRAEQELERLFLRRSSLENNLARLNDEKSAAEDQLNSALALLIDGPTDADENALGKAREAVQTARLDERNALSAVTEFQRETERAADHRRALNREQQDWTRREALAEERLEGLGLQRTEIRNQLDAANATPDQLTERTEALAEQVEIAEKARQKAADTLLSAEAELRDAELVARRARDASASARENFARMDVRLEAAQRREEDVSAQAAARFDCSLKQLEQLASAGLSSLQVTDEPFDPQESEIRLNVVKREIDALGPVNLEADAQLEDIASRMELQTRERDDLTAAIAKLQEGVSALNKEGAARLVAAYREVDAHFRSLFENLFQGGEAQLKLTESDDPLEAGLEIYACPPGKRLGALSLMSGGEQALTATALIFAVFLSSPAPICVLDEVDAPLDDANVDRYCRLLDEMRKRTDTRFVAITHNAVTMSRMDRLFGVTMQERGVSKLVSVDLQAAEQLAAAQ